MLNFKTIPCWVCKQKGNQTLTECPTCHHLVCNGCKTKWYCNNCRDEIMKEPKP